MKNLKNYYIILLCIICFISCTTTKKEYKITGEVPTSWEMDSIFLYDGAKVINKSAVVDGKFEIKGHTDVIKHLVLGNMKIGFNTSIILENMDYKLSVRIQRGIIEGGNIQKIMFGYMNDKEYVEMDKDLQNFLINEFNKIDVTDEDALEKMRPILYEKEDKLMDYANNQYKKIIDGNYPTIAKAFALMECYDWEAYGIEKREKMLVEYQNEIGNNEGIAQYLKLLREEKEAQEITKSVAIGKDFKDFIAKDKNGKEIKFSDIVKKNKFTMLELWASWCGPCRAEIPNLKENYAKYKKYGFEIFSVSLDKKENAWLKACEEEEMNWTSVRDELEFSGVAKMYGVRGIPASFLIDKNGKIIAISNDLRGKELGKTLSRLLK